ncbi:hypothetical protein K1719_028101 [Acacia pycnantha]|nr:hypothetical protein K1719_028101 [Acacia pycnantha]
MDKSWIKMPRSSPVYLAGLNTFLDFAFSHASINGKIPFPEAYTFWEVHGEQLGMGYGLHLPRTSQVGNQVHQDDPVNEAVRDAFGVQDDNFTVEVRWSEPVFFRMMQLGNFSASWMRAIVLCIKVVINTQSYLLRSNCTISSACVGSPIRQCRCSGITSRCIPVRTFPVLLRGEEDNQRLGLNYQK